MLTLHTPQFTLLTELPDDVIYVGNIPHKATDNEIRSHFSSVGECKIVKRNRDSALMEFNSKKEMGWRNF